MAYFRFPITKRFPPVVQLGIDLENRQRVYFNEDTAAQIAAGDPPATTLTRFLCFAPMMILLGIYCILTRPNTASGKVPQSHGNGVSEASLSIQREFLKQPQLEGLYHRSKAR